MPKREKKPDTSGLNTYSLGKESKLPDCGTAWKLYERGLDFNSSINLEDTVRVNENFFIGKQWEGVISNGLPTPVFNFLKRVCCFTVATITSDNIKVNASPLSATPNTTSLVEPVRIINEELDALTELNNIPSLMREFARNAAVDGDGCLYTWWDPDAETGQDAKGCIRTEIVENLRVHFGNPNDRDVQSQPWIILERREIISAAQAEAKENGFETWRNIGGDGDNTNPDAAKETTDKVTTILLFWRDTKTRHIWAYKCARGSSIREPWDLGIKRYPISWLNWDYIQDCFHGQAMITGLIPNQIFVNKLWAMSQLSLMTTAFPKVVYDATRVGKWDNRIGAAIGIQGGDVNNVAKIIDPASISPQISQFIQLAVEETEQSLGATSVALGDTRPDNTSAIIALQRAASTPSEITKQNLYKSIEDLYRIYIEFMGEYYGKRYVDMTTPEEVRQVYDFIGQATPAEIPMQFDFSQLKDMPMHIKLDIGASSYYSEIASIQTLDNLLKMGKIDTIQYLERIPDGYIPGRRELINELKEQQRNAMAMQAQMQQGSPQNPGGAPVAGDTTKDEIPTGGGYSALQRKVNETGTTAGMV
nr:MAG TPA: portal protein [Caudoviricetes sp.]